MNRSDRSDLAATGLGRRLAALLYDSLLVLALLFVAASVALLFRRGEPVPQNLSWYTLYFAAVPFVFFTGFWYVGGQTLGMRAWRLRLTSRRDGSLTRWQVSLRFLVALVSLGCLGLGFFWQLVDSDKLTWHDRAAGTRVVIDPPHPP